jgi:hypothetical protein
MMPDLEQLQSFRRGLLLGKPSSPDTLTSLALAAMLSRFERVRMPRAAVAPMPTLKRANFPSDTARRAMLRLLSGRDGNINDSMAAAVPAVLQQRGLSLHPFDFARLEEFVARYGSELSQDALLWLRLIRPERKEIDDPYLDGPITEEHLMQASKAQRIQYLKELRTKDAGRARALVEGMLVNEAADMRLRLLKVLANRPNADDRPLLESLLKDRAPTIKDLALALLSRIPGTETFAAQVTRLKDSLQIKTEGILRRKKVFVFKGANPKPGQDRFANLLASLSISDFSKAFGEEPTAIISVAMNSDNLLDLQLGLVRKAVDERNIPLIRSACEELNDHDCVLMSALIDDEFAVRPENERTQILDLCFTPRIWKQLPSLNVFSQIASRIPPALPAPMARDLLAQAGWSGVGDDAKKIYLDAVAHLIPQQLSIEFSHMAETVAPRATLYHRFLSSLT